VVADKTRASLIFIRGTVGEMTMHQICATEFSGPIVKGLPDLNLKDNAEFISQSRLWFDIGHTALGNKVVFLVYTNKPRVWFGLRVFSIEKGKFVNSEAVVASFLKPIMEIAKNNISWAKELTHS
jgi:hypothetical protein